MQSSLLALPYTIALVITCFFTYWTQKDKDILNKVTISAILFFIVFYSSIGHSLSVIISLVVSLVLAFICFIYVPSGGFKIMPLVAVALPITINNIGIPLYLAISICSISLLYVSYYCAKRKIYLPLLIGLYEDSEEPYINIPAHFLITLLIFSVLPVVSATMNDINTKLFTLFSTLGFKQVLILFCYGITLSLLVIPEDHINSIIESQLEANLIEEKKKEELDILKENDV